MQLILQWRCETSCTSHCAIKQMAKIVAREVASSVEQSRSEFYFWKQWQRLFLALQRVQLVSQCLLLGDLLLALTSPFACLSPNCCELHETHCSV